MVQRYQLFPENREKFTFPAKQLLNFFVHEEDAPHQWTGTMGGLPTAGSGVRSFFPQQNEKWRGPAVFLDLAKRLMVAVH